MNIPYIQKTLKTIKVKWKFMCKEGRYFAEVYTLILT